MKLPNPITTVMTAPMTAVMTAATRLRAALVGERRERAILLALAVYVLVWAVYGTIAKSSQGLHYDMTEVIAWSRDLSWGYLKHPPLAAALVWVWFQVLPVGEFSYYLLAMLMPAVALWFAWRLSADYLTPDKRVAGLALLMLVPFFNFHALKFNVNTVMMPVWAATVFWFLRSYRSRSAGYAALAGFGAALTMLAKYWSVFLLVGLVVAALIDRRRAGYFRSPAPWITVAVGLIAMAPHLYWLQTHDFAPFSYAIGIHGDKPLVGTVTAALGYLGGSLGYIALPVILVLAVARPNRATLADMVWPRDDDRRLAAAAFWLPFLLPVVGAIASGTEITSLWSMPAWTLLPVLLLSPAAVTWRDLDSRRVLLTAMALPLAMLIAAPVIAIMAQRAGPPPAAAQAALLAAQVENQWRSVALTPLRFVGGDEDLAYGVAAYAADKPRALPQMMPPADDLKRDGMALVCFSGETICKNAAAQYPGSLLVESTILRNFWGFAGKPQRYTIVIVPPRR
jgi:hypothetical protein